MTWGKKKDEACDEVIKTAIVLAVSNFVTSFRGFSQLRAFGKPSPAPSQLASLKFIVQILMNLYDYMPLVV